MKYKIRKEFSNKVISFDYDGTLDDHFDRTLNPLKDEIRNIFQHLIQQGNKILIITKRYGPESSNLGLKDEHKKVYEFGESMGIPPNQIFFTNRNLKFNLIQRLEIDYHFDDDIHEAETIRKATPTAVIHIEDPYWRDHIY